MVEAAGGPSHLLSFESHHAQLLLACSAVERLSDRLQPAVVPSLQLQRGGRLADGAELAGGGALRRACRPRDRLHEGVRSDGLGQIIVHARLKTLLLVGLGGERRQRQHGHAPRRRRRRFQFANQRGGGEAVHQRQGDVHQDQLERLARPPLQHGGGGGGGGLGRRRWWSSAVVVAVVAVAVPVAVGVRWRWRGVTVQHVGDGLHRLGAVARAADAVAVALEHAAHHPPVEIIVLDDEDAKGRGRDREGGRLLLRRRRLPATIIPTAAAEDEGRLEARAAPRAEWTEISPPIRWSTPRQIARPRPAPPPRATPPAAFSGSTGGGSFSSSLIRASCDAER